MRTIAIIPARYRSSRLPGKPLCSLQGRSMIEHVYQRAQLAPSLETVIVATDDQRIFDAVEAFGGEAVMTADSHISGTDRVAEANETLDADFIVNLQGDEPLIAPEAIEAAIAVAHKHPEAIASLKHEITSREELLNPHVVKVTTSEDGRALYFSRSAIPYPPTGDSPELPRGLFYKHIGLYVYPKDLLRRLSRLDASSLEKQERLEQMRALENGIPIRVAETDHDSVSVDTQEDLERVRELIRHRLETVKEH